jgi:hypothetical protein
MSGRIWPSAPHSRIVPINTSHSKARERTQASGLLWFVDGAVPAAKLYLAYVHPASLGAAGGCLWVLLKQEPPRQAAELPIAAVPVRRRPFPANAPRPFRAGKGALGLAWWVACSLILTTRGVAVEIEDTLVDLGPSVSFRGSGRLGSIRGSFGPWEPREFLTALFQDS